MSDQTKKTHFRTIQNFKTDYSPVSISQYVSEQTGMHVVVVDEKGPKVRGFFALATEIFDDSGSPHTLEHLIFMGSKNFRYKGLLDKLATRAYSSTNAWTATDHTAYTLDTAGWDAFAQMLPVYLEHVILPALTDEGCYTEVHHIDGEGNDAGVVYSEMQGVQNTGGEIMDRRARRLLYPEAVGFRYETGGLMENLRVLTAERIRAFHKEMYQPKNLCLVLCGEIDHKHLLQVLDEFEEGILDDIPPANAPFKRPWVDSPQPPPLTASIIEIVQFPEEDESTGDILIGMFGPDCTDPVETAALTVLLTYLAGSSVSILENIMVEKEELASSIEHNWDARPNSVIWLQPSGVATERLSHVEQRLFELLKEVASSPLDMSYMLDCVRRERRRVKYQAESSASSIFADSIINDFLFGKRDGSTLRDLDSLKEYDTLEKWSDEKWRDLLRKWMSDAPHISLLGTPSKEMAENIRNLEEKRIAARKEELGPDGLEKLAEKLKAAIAKNNIEIPTSLLQKWPVPGVESIHFIKTTSARSGLARNLGTPSNNVQEIINRLKPDLPLFLQFEHVPSNFVHLTILFGTSQIATEHRPLLPLFMDNFFNTPIMRGGKRVGFEEVVTQLEKDTISYSINSGRYFNDAEGLAIDFHIEQEKYVAAIEWVRAMMFDSIFDETRLNAGMSKMLAEIPEEKRDGDSMLYAVDSMIHLDKDSNSKARGTLVKAIYMKRLKKLLAKEPGTVISWLEALRKSLFTFNNMRALVIANVETLPDPVESWKPLIAGLDTGKPLLPMVKVAERLSPDGQNPGNHGAVIVPMPTIDSSFLIASSKGPRSYTDPVLPSLMVAISFFNAVEGPLWTAVRGTGLAYGCYFKHKQEGGFIQFSVYRSPDAYRAFAAAKAILESYINGTEKLEQPALEGAISQIVVGFADEQSTMDAAGQFHFINSVVRGVDDEYNTRILKQVRSVTGEEIIAVMRDILLPVFTPGKANVVVTCAPIMEEGIVKSFKESGFKSQSQALSSFQEDYGLHGDGDDDSEEGEGGSEDGDSEEHGNSDDDAE